MRILIVNTSEKTGGAAVAANRLKDALNNNGVKAKMLVRDKLTDDITVVSLGHECVTNGTCYGSVSAYIGTFISLETTSLR